MRQCQQRMESCRLETVMISPNGLQQTGKQRRNILSRHLFQQLSANNQYTEVVCQQPT